MNVVRILHLASGCIYQKYCVSLYSTVRLKSNGGLMYTVLNGLHKLQGYNDYKDSGVCIRPQGTTD